MRSQCLIVSMLGAKSIGRRLWVAHKKRPRTRRGQYTGPATPNHRGRGEERPPGLSAPCAVGYLYQFTMAGLIVSLDTSP